MNAQTDRRSDSTARGTVRIGSVSYLNARPLVEGLDATDGLELHFDVPSRLLDGLKENRFGVALLPVIDYPRHAGLRLLTAGGIACDGPALTVRIFSKVPIDKIRALACDTESHTSVALAKILLVKHIGARANFIDLPRDGSAGDFDAQLLIGDKVISRSPADHPHQLDLGEAWKKFTGLPFVFAAWMAREEINLAGLHARLFSAKRAGLANIDAIVARHAVPRGWPANVARDYLTKNLQYDITPQHVRAIETFHRLAAEHGLIDDVAPLRVIAE